MGPASRNSNHVELQCGPLLREIPDGRGDLDLAEHRSELQRRRLSDPSYRNASLQSLAKSRDGRSWSDEAIFEAIRSFYSRHRRAPQQNDFRSGNGLPGYGTIWRRFGSVSGAVATALGGRPG